MENMRERIGRSEKRKKRRGENIVELTLSKTKRRKKTQRKRNENSRRTIH